MHVNELTDVYLKPTGNFKRKLIGANREAPAIVKHNNKYYLVTSLCTGWDPNAAMYAVADSVMGDWQIQVILVIELLMHKALIFCLLKE